MHELYHYFRYYSRIREENQRPLELALDEGASDFFANSFSRGWVSSEDRRTYLLYDLLDGGWGEGVTADGTYLNASRLKGLYNLLARASDTETHKHFASDLNNYIVRFKDADKERFKQLYPNEDYDGHWVYLSGSLMFAIIYVAYELDSDAVIHDHLNYDTRTFVAHLTEIIRDDVKNNGQIGANLDSLIEMVDEHMRRLMRHASDKSNESPCVINQGPRLRT